MRVLIVLVAMFSGAWFAQAQDVPTELSKPELEKIVPANYFFAGQTASTQVRNSGAVRFGKDRYLVIALVDTSGYSSAVAQKYQGLLITQVAFQVDGKTVPPGSYGFGIPSPERFNILDINADELAGGPTTALASGQRAVPLQVKVTDSGIVVSLGKRSFVLQSPR